MMLLKKWKTKLLKLRDLLSDIIYKYSPIYINTLNLRKPLREWNKVHYIFKKPSAVKTHCKVKDLSFKLEGPKYRIFEMNVQPVSYKISDDIQHEYNPYRLIVLFNRWVFLKEYTAPKSCVAGDIIYWEGLLSYIYDIKCKNNLYDVYKKNIWQARYDNKDVEYTIIDMLTPRYKEYLQNYIDVMKLIQSDI